MSHIPLNSKNPWLKIKTNQRIFYDQLFTHFQSKVDEVIFVNERGELCEGTRTNLFLGLDGKRVTPALECGLLPGVLRQELLAKGWVEEAVLRLEDLYRAERIWVGNSLRGLIPAELSPALHPTPRPSSG